MGLFQRLFRRSKTEPVPAPMPPGKDEGYPWSPAPAKTDTARSKRYAKRVDKGLREVRERGKDS